MRPLPESGARGEWRDLRRRALIILNPSAGRSRSSRRRLDRIVAALRQIGCAVVLRRAGPETGDAERLAREAEAEFEVIVAAGGDGTIHAVANGLAARPRPLALLPFGTANVLAREIGLPRDPERLAALIAGGQASPMWPGRIGDRLFLTTAGSGFDAEIVAAVGPRLKRRFGRLAFAWAILVRLCRYRRRDLVIEVDGVGYRAAAVIAVKGRLYAGSHVVAPQAELADPALFLVLFRRSGRLAVLRYLGALLIDRLPYRDDVTVLRARTALISAAEPLPVQADGELVATLPVTLGIGDRPLLLVRPSSC